MLLVKVKIKGRWQGNHHQEPAEIGVEGQGSLVSRLRRVGNLLFVVWVLRACSPKLKEIVGYMVIPRGNVKYCFLL